VETLISGKASVSGSPRWKLYLAILLWMAAAVCAVSVFRELPWAANADYRDFYTYYSPAYPAATEDQPLCWK
jgi:hypothetical protein